MGPADDTTDDGMMGTQNGGESIVGDERDDSIVAGDGDDTVESGRGDDTIHGGAGNDSLRGGQGNDRIEGGEGDDTIDQRYQAGTDTLAGGAGDDSLIGGSNASSLSGGEGRDTIEGGAAEDTVFGGAGDDTLSGGGGNDYVDGGTGDDRIDAGAYDGGNDTIAFGPGAGSDTIDGWHPEADFVHIGDLAQGDIIVTRLGPKQWELSIRGGDPNDVMILDYDFYFAENLSEADIRDQFITASEKTRPPDPTPACFTPGCRVNTMSGPVRIELLRPGDMIPTHDGSILPLLDLLGTRIAPGTVADDPSLRPVVLPRSCVAPGLPSRRMRVSSQHGFLVALPGGDRLIRARHLVEHLDLGHRQIAPNRAVHYLHVALSRHGIIKVDGLWSESFLSGPMTGHGDLIQRRLTDRAAFNLPTRRAHDLLTRREIRRYPAQVLRAALVDAQHISVDALGVSGADIGG